MQDLLAQEETVLSGDFSINYLLFGDDVVLLASSDLVLLPALRRFATECEAVGMRVGSSELEAPDLCRTTMGC